MKTFVGYIEEDNLNKESRLIEVDGKGRRYIKFNSSEYVSKRGNKCLSLFDENRNFIVSCGEVYSNEHEYTQTKGNGMIYIDQLKIKDYKGRMNYPISISVYDRPNKNGHTIGVTNANSRTENTIVGHGYVNFKRVKENA